jgi:hypothetical protein
MLQNGWFMIFDAGNLSIATPDTMASVSRQNEHDII